MNLIRKILQWFKEDNDHHFKLSEETVRHIDVMAKRKGQSRQEFIDKSIELTLRLCPEVDNKRYHLVVFDSDLKTIATYVIFFEDEEAP